jgi:hypothetical protein
MEQVEATSDSDAQRNMAQGSAIPIRIQMGQTASAMINYLLQTVTNHSELGTIANIEQQSFYRRAFVTGYDERLVELTGRPIPVEAHLSRDYHGPTRIIVPAKRGRICKGEAFHLQVMILSQQRPEKAELLWRKAGSSGAFKSVALDHIARSVYEVTLDPKQIDSDFEYCLRVVNPDQTYYYPTTAPEITSVVIVTE